MDDVQSLDPETEFLASKKQTGNEWELFKENVRPLKRGRNVNLLNESLKSQTDTHLRKSLLEKRRSLIEAIDEYKGEDPLQPWLECIKWVQESFPSGGDFSELVVIYEQCVRTFWHSDQYKDDLRYLKLWLEYADNCADAEEIYRFLDANKIGQTHSVYYISFALHMESKNKLRNANEIFNLGIARKAQPIEKLEDAYKKFFSRSMRSQKATEEEPTDNFIPVRNFGTVLVRGEAHVASGRPTTESSDLVQKKLKQDRAHTTPLAIYKETNAGTAPSHQPESSKIDTTTWHTLGTRAERNKENTTIPTKWKSNKIPQRPGFRTGAASASACIKVFVDEECVKSQTAVHEGGRASILQLRRVDSQDIKKETELLRKNPLRNFPPNSLPR